MKDRIAIRELRKLCVECYAGAFLNLLPALLETGQVCR